MVSFDALPMPPMPRSWSSASSVSADNRAPADSQQLVVYRGRDAPTPVVHRGDAHDDRAYLQMVRVDRPPAVAARDVDRFAEITFGYITPPSSPRQDMGKSTKKRHLKKRRRT